ncbi:MAG: PAC2 family protein [Chloroflexi bacterium]|nr:PAC2 family protein [Chloroflexota bacterium]
MNYLRLHRSLPRDGKTLILAFAGWSDAGDAATGAVNYLIRARKADLLAEVESEEFYDFTQHRPVVQVDAGGVRQLTWPLNQFYLAPATKEAAPLVLFSGVEPSLKWRTFTNAFLDVAQECGVERVITFGALLNAVPHTRAIQVNGSATTPEIQQIMADLGIFRGGSYHGPTGIASTIIEGCQQRGIAHASFWGHVPHYIQTSPNPPVIHAILEGLRRAFGISVDMRDLESQAAAFQEKCEQAIAQEPSMKAYIRRLEQYYDDVIGAQQTPLVQPPGEIPNPQELVRDLEEFLRRRRGENGGGQGQEG